MAGIADEPVAATTKSSKRGGKDRRGKELSAQSTPFVPKKPVISHENDVVDLIMNATLGEHDPTESPLIVLECQHAFTTETLDGIVDLELVYCRGSDGNWIGFKNLSELDPMIFRTKLKCPQCRSFSFAAVRRYGRALNFASLRFSQYKHARFFTRQGQILQEKISALDPAHSQMFSAANRLFKETAAAVKKCQEDPLKTIHMLELRRFESCNVQPSFRLSPQLGPLCELLTANLRASIFLLRLKCLERQPQPAPHTGRRQPEKGARGPRGTPAAAAGVDGASGSPSAAGDSISEILESSGKTLKIAKKLRENAVEYKSKRYEVEAAVNHALVHLLVAQYIAGKGQDGQKHAQKGLTFLGEKCVLDAVSTDETRRDQVRALETQLKNVGISRQEIAAVLTAIKRDIGGFHGHVYQCPNGHIFTIGCPKFFNAVFFSLSMQKLRDGNARITLHRLRCCRGWRSPPAPF